MTSDLKLEEKAGSLDGSTPSQLDSPDTTKEGFVVAGSPIEVSGKGDLDIAAEFLKLHEGEHGEYTETEAKEVLFKIDIWVIPMLLITITLAAVDKIIISNAALYGMKTDTHLVGQEYSWVGSIFYFGYLISEFPTNALIQKLPIGRFLGATTIIWSATVILMGATNNAAGLMTLRFFMGMLEAPVFPVCSVMTVMWYKKQEQPLRVALWLSGFSSLFAGIVSYGIGHTSTEVAPWRLLFIVLGGVSLLWGIFIYLFLPDSPLSAHFLNDRQKYIAVHRIKENMTGIENKKLKWYQVREAFTDWKTWPLVVYCFCINIANGGLVTFAAQIVSGLGYSALRTTLLGMPTGVVMTGSALVVSIPASQFKNMRCISAATCALIPLACCVLMMKLPKENKKGLLAAYYCFYCYWGGYPTVTSIPLANTSGHTKKVTRNALMFLSYCVGNIVAPQFFITAEAPGYKTGYRAILGSLSIAIFSLLGYAAGVRYENKRTLMKLDGQEPGAQVAGDEVLADLTDKEKKGFVYVY